GPAGRRRRGRLRAALRRHPREDPERAGPDPGCELIHAAPAAPRVGFHRPLWAPPLAALSALPAPDAPDTLRTATVAHRRADSLLPRLDQRFSPRFRVVPERHPGSFRSGRGRTPQCHGPCPRPAGAASSADAASAGLHTRII